MYYKMSESLREKISNSIQRRSMNLRNDKFFTVVPREIVPRDVFLANGRIVTTQQARDEIRKYRFGSKSTTNTMPSSNDNQLIHNLLRIFKFS